MVSIAINRNSGTFDKAVADELNKAFYSINKKIENYKTEPLEYKERLQYTSSNTFITDNCLHIRETFRIENPGLIFTRFIKMAELPIEVPNNVWLYIMSESGKSAITVHILNKDISVYGTTFEGEVFDIIADIILP